MVKKTQSDKISWTTERRKVSDLIPHAENPRLMTKKQVEDLKKSFGKFDLAEIPAINLDNTILAGHQRMSVMKLLGRGDEEIDIRVPNRLLDEKEAKEYLVRSNKNTGDWDYEILANCFDMGALQDWGFTEEELVGDDIEVVPPEADGEDDSFSPPTDPITEPGDLYTLGDHILVCGDATVISDVEKLGLQGEDGGGADMIFTDPPYGVAYKGKTAEALT